MPEKRDIFISYSRANTDFARDLYAKLQALGFTLWRDRNDMIGGENWWQQIQEAIRGVQNMVLVMSPDALRSEVVADEWRYARQVGTRVIPVLAEDVDFSTVKRWMKKRDWYDFREGAPERDLIWEKFIALLRKPYGRRRVPFTAPAKPEHCVERPGIFQRAKALLLREDRSEQNNTLALTTAFRGGSFGKTTLAIALCHDPEVRERFDDGVLFIVLGEQPDIVALLNDQIALISGERPAFTDLNAAAARFRELVDGTDMLIVLDDVWDEADAKPFKEGERAVRLITSRSAAITNALGVRGENALEVSQMAPDEAAELLLARLAPERRPADRSQFIAFAAELGGWALLLSLAGAHIADFVENDGMSAHEALAEERARLREYGFAIFDPEDETARDRAIGANLALSLKRLGKWQERFEELAIFPEDADVPPAAIGKLWRACAGLSEGDTKEALRAMQRLSLFAAYQMSEASQSAEPQDQTSKPRKFVRLHDVIRKYLRGRLGARLPELHKKFLGAYGVEHWAELPRDEPYLWEYLAYHLLEAGKRDELRAALLEYRYLQAKLDARDANALLSDFRAFLRGGDDKPVRMVRQALDLSVYALTKDKAALAHQLYSRLHAQAELLKIAALREQISAILRLLPLNEPTHEMLAGSRLLRILREHKDTVRGVRELKDRRLLSWSLEGILRLWTADGIVLKVLKGHEESIGGALELRDGRLLSWSFDTTLRLWAADGTELAVLRGHEGGVYGALELRDGRLLSWGYNTLRLWAADGTETVLRGHEGEVRGARELRDGRLLSWSGGFFFGTLRLWAADGTEIAVLRGHEGWVRGALELRDGRLLSWSLDRTLRLWAADGTEIAVLRGHEDWVRGALELRDGRLLSWSADTTLRLWAADGTERAVLRGHRGVVLGALELRDGRLLSWSADTTLRLWAADGTERAVLRGHEGSIEGALELRDGRLLSWSADTTLRLWAADGTERAVLRGHRGEVRGALELRDGRLLSWSADTTLRLWAADGTETVLRGHEGSIEGTLGLRDGRLLSWSRDKTLRLWAADGTETVLRGHEDWVWGALELRDGRLLSWSRDQTLRLWAADGTELAVLRGHESVVSGALELRDGRLLSWSWDNTLRLWAADGTERAILRGHEGSIEGALGLRDGRLLSWSEDWTLRLWAADGTERAVLRGHERGIEGALELRDGRLLSWSWDEQLRLWAADGTEIAVLRGHEDWVSGALELRDGRLLSWAEDKTLRLWAADGTERAVLRGHWGEVRGALELRDGRLLSWSDDGTLRLWAADGTPLGAIRIDASPSELRAWFAAHDADWRTFIENWERYALAPERGLLAWRLGAALHLCRAETGEELARFYADSNISVARFLQGGAVIALGCENGQVIFLKVNL